MPDESTPVTTDSFDPKKYLKLIKVKGGGTKMYLPAAARLTWLRAEQPTAKIVTEAIQLTEKSAIFKCTITLDNGAVAVSHGSETAGDFGDFYEKAETKSISRALGAIGYGTEDVDFDEETFLPANAAPARPGGFSQPSTRFTAPSAPVFAPSAPPQTAPVAPPPTPLVTEPDDRAGRPRLWSEAGLVVDSFEYSQDPRPLTNETETAIRNLAAELGLPIYGLVMGLNALEGAAHARGALAAPRHYSRLGDFPEQLGVDIRDGFLLPVYERGLSLAAPESALGD